MRQVGTRKTCQKRPVGMPGRGSLLKRRKVGTVSKPGVLLCSSGRAWRVPVYWPGGTRRRGGVSLVCCSCTEREKASVDTAAVQLGRSRPPGRERECAEAETVGTEYRCGARRRTGL
jgi:hypothetical protein